MSWWDDLRETVSGVIETAETTAGSSVDLSTWLEELVTAIGTGDTAAANELFDKLSPYFPASELGKLLLGIAVLRDNDDTIAAVVTFITDRALLTTSELIAAMFKAVPDEGHRIHLLQVLANTSWGVGGLVTAIAGSGVAAEAIALLLRITYTDGLDVLVQRLLVAASRAGAENVFRLLVRALHDRPGFDAPWLVLLALGIVSPERDTAVGRLVKQLASEHWLDIQSVVAHVFTRQPSWIERLVRVLVDSGAVAWTEVRRLLEIPIRLFANQPADALTLFTLIFAALHAAAATANHIGTLATEVAAWLGTSGGTSVFAGEAPLERRVGGLGVLDVPMPAWLVGKALAGSSGSAAAMPGPLTAFVFALVSALHDAGAAGQQVLVWIGRVPAAFVVLLPALILIAAAIPMRFLEWIGQDIRKIHEHDRQLKIKELTPATKQKYMIFSDLHRDASSDRVHPYLFDVTHFSANKEMYKRALTYCKDHGYVVIENGDCEELWYRPHVVDSVEDRSADVLTTHGDVYAILRDLHSNNRYFRTRGNHDNWWNFDPARLPRLQRLYGSGFEIYDGLVIPEVKDMEQDLLGILEAANTDDVLQYLIDRLPLGLSPDHYRSRKPLFVLHGHQVDFWNCDEHQFLGLVITNAVGVPADGIDALPYYLKGIDIAGNPWLKFADYITKRRDWQALVPSFVEGILPGYALAEVAWRFSPWDNWPPEDVSKAWARQIEFMEETDRRLHDSLSFSETLAASLSLLLGYDSFGPIKPCSLPGPQIQIAMGHTHNPQSRPYLNFPEPTIDVKTPRGTYEYQMSWMKVPYYNSGTGGWWEGIIWALEIDEAGQAQLVYWDRQSCEPQVMSWELHGDPIIRPADLHNLANDLSQIVAAGNADLNAAIARLRALVPFALPNVAGTQSFPLADMSQDEQVAAAAYGILVALKRLVCEPSMPPANVEFEIDLRKLPRLDARVGTLARLMREPRESPVRTLGAWIDQFGLGGDPKAWTRCTEEDLQRLAAALMFTAFCHGAGLLQTVGFIAHLCASRSQSLDYRFDRGRGVLGVRIAIEGEAVAGKPTQHRL